MITEETGTKGGPVLWFRMNSATFLDERILDLSSTAELIFYRSIMLSAMTETGGVIPEKAIPQITQKVRRYSARATLELRDHGLWVDVASTPEGTLPTHLEVRSGYVIKNYSRYNASPVVNKYNADEQGKQPQQADSPRAAARPRTEARDRARVNKQTNKGSDRTLSGSVRSEPAQPAPRSAGGAAQPAPKPDVVDSEEDGEVLPAELAQKKIREILSKSTMLTGKASPLGRSEWLPNREPSRFNGVMNAMDEELEKLKAAEPENHSDE